MNSLIEKGAPLALSLLFGLVGVVAVLISEGAALRGEQDDTKRRQKAVVLMLKSLPGSLCLSAFSYDIWVITTLFSADSKTVVFYNLTGKQTAVLLLLVSHLGLYLFALAWGGMVRAKGEIIKYRHLAFEIILGLLAVVFCVVFQRYQA